MHDVTVYTQKHCQPCKFTKRKLTEAGIAFTEADATNLDNHRYIAGRLGHQQAPVVTVHHDGKLIWHWSGFKPSAIDTLIAAARGEEDAA